MNAARRTMYPPDPTAMSTIGEIRAAQAIDPACATKFTATTTIAIAADQAAPAPPIAAPAPRRRRARATRTAGAGAPARAPDQPWSSLASLPYRRYTM